MKNNIEFIELPVDLIHPDEQFAIYCHGGVETQYTISTEGRVYNTLTGKFRKVRTRPSGHNDINLSLGTKDSCVTVMVYRMVAETFLDGQDKSKGVNTVDHVDGVHEGDSIRNLEWVTASENIKRAAAKDLLKRDISNKGDNCIHSKYTESQVRHACEMKEADIPHTEIAEKTGINYNYLGKIFNGLKWSHISSKYTLNNFHKHSEDFRDRVNELITTDLSNKEITSILEKEFNKQLSKTYVKDFKHSKLRKNKQRFND